MATTLRKSTGPSTSRVVWWTVGIVIALALIIFFTTRTTAENDSPGRTAPPQEIGQGGMPEIKIAERGVGPTV